MEKDFEVAKKVMGNNILLNSFDLNRRSFVITNASGEDFAHIILQKTNDGQFVSGNKQ